MRGTERTDRQTGDETTKIIELQLTCGDVLHSQVNKVNKSPHCDKC